MRGSGWLRSAGWRMGLLWAAGLLLVAAAARGQDARGQTLHAANPGAGTLTLDGAWRFHTGDDPVWRAQGFDDRGWEQLKAEAPWGAQGHPGYAGFAWYRRRVDVDGPGPAMGVLFPPVDDAYEVFWNGERIGGYGRLPPHARWFAFGHMAVYALPGTDAGTMPGSTPGLMSGAVHGELAVRVWKAPFYLLDDPQGGGFEDAPVLGDPDVLELMRKAPELGYANAILPRATTGLLLLVAGLTAAVFWLIDRQMLFVWLAGTLLSSAAYSLLWLPPIRFGWSAQADQIATLVCGSGGEPFLWYLFLTIFGLNVSRGWRRATAILTSVFMAAVLGDCAVVLLWAHAGAGLRWTDDVLSWMNTVLPLYSLLIVGFGLRSRRPMGIWPLAAAVIASEAYGFVATCSQQFINLGSQVFALLTRPRLVVGPYSMSIHTLLDLQLSVVLIFTVVRVQARQWRRQTVLESEMRSAREVQQVLLPEEVPDIPGFSIATVYQPAAEVGGDFFQVIPTSDGCLVVVGDVSGKGLAAAMTVSLIVGTLRTLAETESGPAAVLTGLNRRLLGRTPGGFTTCLAMHLGVGGEVRLATAGHPAPFWNGRELALAAAMPLGLTDDLDVEEGTVRLAVGDRLILYTDGLPEARNDKGELLGFDGVARLLAADPPAEEIVAAARNFGQEDDITVLTLTRSAGETLSPGLTGAAALSAIGAAGAQSAG